MTPSPIPFPLIQPLVRDTKLAKTRLTCTFACPVTDKTEHGTADVISANGLGTKVRSRVRTSAIQSMTRSVTRTLRSLLGNNVVGKLAGELTNDQAKNLQAGGGFRDEEMQAATVAAFEQVRARFAWDDASERYVHVQALQNAKAQA